MLVARRLFALRELLVYHLGLALVCMTACSMHWGLGVFHVLQHAVP